MEGLWLAIGFVLASLLAQTAVPSLPMPFALVPLMLICGILVMNRVSVVHGAAWLVLSGVVLQLSGTAPGRLPALCVSAGIGVVLAERVFAKRSVYALLGLGLTTGAVFVVLECIHRVVAQWLSVPSAVGMSVGEGVWTLLLLVIGLYVGFALIVTARRWLGNRFVVR